jgi:hypothetical protein
MRRSRLKYVVPGVLAVGACAVSFACSATDATTSSERSSGGPDGTGSSSGAGASATDGAAAPSTDLAPTDNAVILVHAAGMPPFRMCFEKEPSLRPQPDQETMPEANVVGVEVGSAVRLAPLKNGAPGIVYVLNEALVRTYAGQGQTCAQLLSVPDIFKAAFKMPAITTDYSKGVHLLVLRGCQGRTILTYTKEECGTDYDPDTTAEGTQQGNLSLLDIELKGARRTTGLPTQVLHLSRALESARNGAELAVTFGDVTSNESFHASKAIDPTLFATKPQDLVESPTFATNDDGVYADVGFRVVLNSTNIVAQQSLADVQKLSAPRAIPSSYYSAASNYVLLLLGSPAEAQQPDGGDPRKGVHLLAVPVVDPDTSDAGTSDGGGTTDAGAGDGGT